MIKLNREEYDTTEYYAFHLYNDIGCTEVEFAYVNGNRFWSKWYSYDTLMHKDKKDTIQLYNNSSKYISVEEFWNLCNNRTILDIEVMLDIDEADGRTDKESIKKKAEKIISKIEEHHISYEAYFSGSKSYHISMLFPELRDYPSNQRKQFKLKIIGFFGGDSMKASQRNMIALEGVQHWKTGNMKVRVK